MFLCATIHVLFMNKSVYKATKTESTHLLLGRDKLESLTSGQKQLSEKEREVVRSNAL
jgi:hypothetical protein